VNDFFQDKQLEQIFGKRPTAGAIALFEPIELGWVCPVCPEKKNYNITWSEFVDHIWCYNCQKDFFTLLCPKKMNPYTTERVLEYERQSVCEKMEFWTIEKYKNLKDKVKP